MLKILSVLAVLWISAVIGEECLYKMELWAALNPTQFCFCNPVTNTRAIGNCMPNTGFVRNATVTGCVPWDSWNTACVSKVNVTTINCGQTSYLQPKSAGNPQKFLLCTRQDTAPVQLWCDPDRGFYSGHRYLGCIPWILWRILTGCTV